jgi:hypothetical protein
VFYRPPLSPARFGGGERENITNDHYYRLKSSLCLLL